MGNYGPVTSSPASLSREPREAGLQDIIKSGGVGERLKPAVLKTVRLERASGVRIPPPPPASLGISLCSTYSSGTHEFAGVPRQNLICADNGATPFRDSPKR